MIFSRIGLDSRDRQSDSLFDLSERDGSGVASRDGRVDIPVVFQVSA